MKKVKEQKNKGFTLVELIVVIVILAILAAILVPALLGYIDKAKNQQIVLNAKSCLTAAQAEFSSMYASGKSPADMTDAVKQDIIDTADVGSVCTELVVGVKKNGNSHEAYTVTYVKYTENNKTMYYDGSSWDTAEVSTTNYDTYDIRTSSSSGSSSENSNSDSSN
jgi:prepilin-type N-terminal cleavage/methylation domain-containing protein